LIDPQEAARVLARERGDSIVVPHPAVERYWTEVSDASERDFMPPQADGEEAAFTLGLALARPDHRVMVLDVDEALLSNLGALVTISDAAPENLVHVCFQSGIRTGAAGLPLPGGQNTDFATIAKGAGYKNGYEFDDLEELAGEAARILAEPGPTMLVIKVNPFSPGHQPGDSPRRYDMADDVRQYRDALTNPDNNPE
jgi:phosphonopyruvate decarboxylase